MPTADAGQRKALAGGSVARGVAAGQGKTEGFHERTDIAFTTATARALSRLAGLDALAELSSAQIEEVQEVIRALRFGNWQGYFGRMVNVETSTRRCTLRTHSPFIRKKAKATTSPFDDLQRVEDEPGADHIGETDLTSGLFYGYVVVDRRMLLDNLGQDADLAGEVVERFVRLIATVSPGAKLGSTAPYGYAAWMLVKAGDCQPRSLAEAFRDPCQPSVEAAEREAREHLRKLDAAYGTGEARRVMSLEKAMDLRAGAALLFGRLARSDDEV